MQAHHVHTHAKFPSPIWFMLVNFSSSTIFHVNYLVDGSREWRTKFAMGWKCLKNLEINCNCKKQWHDSYTKFCSSPLNFLTLIIVHPQVQATNLPQKLERKTTWGGLNSSQQALPTSYKGAWVVGQPWSPTYVTWLATMV